MKWILFLLTTALHAYSPLSLYPIDPTTRGQNLLSYFNVLKADNYTTNPREVVIQTNATPAYIYSFGVFNGVIPFIKDMKAAPNHTAFIVHYLPTGTAQTQYLVVFVEQIVEMAYYLNFNNVPNIQSGFSSNFTANVLPLYSLAPVPRAADIASVVTTLISSAPYLVTNVSKVSIQTTLTGPFYPYFSNGLIPDIQSISVISANDSLLKVTYRTTQLPNIIGSVLVSAEQVQQIVYYPNGISR